jgi:hypothetical protein
MDDDIYEMFLEIINQIHTEDTDGRARLLSKDPRYASDPPAEQTSNNKYIGR